MRTERRAWPQVAVSLLLAGVIVGSLVAAAALADGRPECPAGLGGESCRDLVEKLSSRAGILAGASTVLMALLVGGLVKMLGQEDRYRAELARETAVTREGLDG